jgi:hypothetical protein
MKSKKKQVKLILVVHFIQPNIYLGTQVISIFKNLYCFGF